MEEIFERFTHATNRVFTNSVAIFSIDFLFGYVDRTMVGITVMDKWV